MIRSLADLTPDGGLATLYDAIAAAVASGAVLGCIGVWVSLAVRGGQR